MATKKSKAKKRARVKGAKRKISKKKTKFKGKRMGAGSPHGVGDEP